MLLYFSILHFGILGSLVSEEIDKGNMVRLLTLAKEDVEMDAPTHQNNDLWGIRFGHWLECWQALHHDAQF